MRLHVCLPAVFCLVEATRPHASDYAAKPVIIDTDIFSDVDDVGALAIANVIHNCGMADLRGVMINTGSQYGALAANAVNTYYHNGDVPIGALRPLTNETFVDRWRWKLGEYASKLAHNFPLTLTNTSSTSDPVTLYRTLLASAPNSSQTLISIGFLTNLAALLTSPSDAISPLSGRDLIASRVAELVVMGGTYPSGWEFNFGGVDVSATKLVLSTWPRTVPITFSGYELGEKIWSGRDLAKRAESESPVLAAYQWYGDRCNTTRKSYDLVTVLYGVLGFEGWEDVGLGPMFRYANVEGYNEVISANGSNAWVEDDGVTNQHWLKLGDGVEVGKVEEVLERFLVGSPSEMDCWFGSRGNDEVVRKQEL